jgi:O-methyltransferase
VKSEVARRATNDRRAAGNGSLLVYYGRLMRQAMLSLAKGVALPLVRREAVRSGTHTPPYPRWASYSPWLSDERFQAVWRTVRSNTLVDEYRCWELWTLVGELVDVPGAIIEVGVWRGGSGALTAARAKELGIEDPVYLCDTWAGVVKAGEEDTYYSGGEHSDTSLETVRSLVERMDLTNVELLQGIFPDDTADKVNAELIRLCHIDVDVYQGASDILDWVWPRLSPGGVVVFDDYGSSATMGVARFVDEQRMQPDRLVVHNLNGHALIIKR